jgi:hypothetical protein
MEDHSHPRVEWQAVKTVEKERVEDYTPEALPMGHAAGAHAQIVGIKFDCPGKDGA